MSRNLTKSLICLALIGVLLFSSLKPAYASNFNPSYVRNLSGQSTNIAFVDFDIDIGEFIQGLIDFFNPDNVVPDSISENSLPEVNPEIPLDSDFEPRFGDESSEIQQYENSLSHAKSEVDADRILLNKEQAEVDDAHFRLNRLSDQISHETNENLVNSYQSEMSSVEAELSSHQQKLEQVRADLSAHQQAEYEAEDKLK